MMINNKVNREGKERERTLESNNVLLVLIQVKNQILSYLQIIYYLHIYYIKPKYNTMS